MDGRVKDAFKLALAVISSERDHCGCLGYAADAYLTEFSDLIIALGLEIYLTGDEDVVRARERQVLKPLIAKHQRKR